MLPVSLLPLAATDGSLLVGGLELGFLILSLGIHEAAHAFVAWRCGDSTAKDLGRMTLDPLPHIDPMMTILVPGAMWLLSGGTMMFGGAKPVPVDYRRLRHPLRDMMYVALAGPISNFLLALLFLLIFKLLVFQFGFASDSVAAQVMEGSMYWNLLLAAFNMIPIPPLDGSRVLTYLLPAPLRAPYNRIESIGLMLLLALMYLGLLGPVLRPVLSTLGTWANVLTGGSWA